MDQLRNFLAQLKKYHFWILCAIVVMVGLTSWYLATAALDKQTSEGATKIKAAEGNVKTVAGIQPHPNAKFEEGMTAILNNHARSVGRGWQHRYKQQEKLLVWPPMLGRDFHRVVEPLRPIEDHVSFDEKDGYEKTEKIPVEFLERYRNFITAELPLIAEQIGAKWTAEPGEGGRKSGTGPGMGKGAAAGGSPYARGGGAAGFRGAAGKSKSEEEEEDDSIVLWSEENQQDILTNHFPFTAEEQTPHTLDVLYAQEDLWVLDAIVKTIKRTNGDADANYNAAIKEIQSIEMGRTVRGRMGKITDLQKANTSTPGAGGSPGMPSMPGGGPPGGTATASSTAAPGPPAGGMPGMGTPGEAGMGATIVDPATDRYVDQDYNPLPPKTLRDAKTDPKLAIYSVAKRMPVRIRVVMDQRKLNTLLAECGNSSLPIEVRQVRINCEAGLVSEGAAGASGSFGAGASGGMGGKGAGGTGGAGGAGRTKSGGRSTGGPGALGMGGRGASSAEAEEDPNEIEVEVYGIVYIYNPENRKQLNDVDWTEDVVAPTAATPAAAPPRG